jgi:TolA-binding protein
MRIAIFTIALVLAASCARRQPPPVVTRTPAPPAAPAPAPPAPPLSVTTLENATQEFARADYAGAARDFQQYLTLVPSGGRRDEALFHLGLIYSQPGDPRLDWQRAGNYFNQVVNEFPNSPLKPAAQLILTLKSETVQLAAESETRNQRIRQLNTELERLIRIDSERRPK